MRTLPFTGSGKIVQRVIIGAVIHDAEVAVDAVGDAAAACLGDLLALVDRLSRGNEQRAVVLIVGLKAVLMVNNDHIAHRTLIAGIAHHAAVRRIDRRAVGHGNVDALVVGGRASDAGVSVAEVRGDAAARRPAEAARGIPARALLGALRAPLGDRLGKRHAREDGALGLLAVDIGDIGHDIRRAVGALGEHLVVALIHARVVGVGDIVLDILDVVLPLGDHNGQIWHGVGER